MATSVIGDSGGTLVLVAPQPSQHLPRQRDRRLQLTVAGRERSGREEGQDSNAISEFFLAPNWTTVGTDGKLDGTEQIYSTT